MKDNPLIVSLLIGLIIILLIAGVSQAVARSNVATLYSKETARNISLEKTVEDIKTENESLNDTIGKLNTQIEALAIQVKDLREENIKVEALKDNIEDNLKEELMKHELKGK
jgi:TolA-binding protein